jgi:hypothetical protein
MATFSYNVLTFTGDVLVENGGVTANDALNAYGQEGWDIVGLVRREAQDHVVVFLRKTQ